MTDDLPGIDMDDLLEEDTPEVSDISQMSLREIGHTIVKKGRIELDNGETQLIQCPGHVGEGTCVCSVAPMPDPNGRGMKMMCNGPQFLYKLSEDEAYTKDGYFGIADCPYQP